MCDLFAMCSNEKDRARRSIPVFSRFSDSNPHGWGIAYYENNKAIIKKKPGRVNQEFFTIMNKAKSNIIISHLRFATQGNESECNCHPFLRQLNNKDWIFAHNGSVKGIEKHPFSFGQTDSEQVFNFIIDEVSEYMNSEQIHGMYPGIVKGIKRIIKRFPEGSLNLLISDGSILYVFNHYKLKPIYLLKREKEYGGAIVVSTQKLSQENWKTIPSDRLLLINRGEILVLSDKI